MLHDWIGCDVDPAAAVDKAVFELCQLRPGMAIRMQSPDYETRLHNYAAVRTLDDHPLVHAIPAHAAEFDFLTHSGAAYPTRGARHVSFTKTRNPF